MDNSLTKNFAWETIGNYFIKILFLENIANRPFVLNNCKFNTTIRAHILVYGINIKLDIYIMFEKLEFFVKISVKNRLSVMAKMKSAIDNQLDKKFAKSSIY